MKTEKQKITELKVGEWYNVRVVVTKIDKTFIYTKTGIPHLLEGNCFTAVEAAAFSPIAPENGTKNTAPAPKYDPCRKFRKGDIVEPCQVKGRWFGTAWKNRSGIRFTVTKDEDEEGVMWVQDPDSLHPKDGEAVFFQLVTPVEELEPYSVQLRQEITVDDTYPYCAVIDHDGNEAARFYSEQYEAGKARAAAEAECAKLNEEYRKEQK